ncbi:hypothetical protein J3A65_002581 [Rhizobium sp. PvP014]|nr:hypothetical protein [Rhizobium sp. PvP014]MBP2529212.1 hypothetical protein [Rhizobium sp. PvP099]
MHHTPFSEYRPRNVLCFLGSVDGFQDLLQAAKDAIKDFATDFEIDMESTQDAPDVRMSESFAFFGIRYTKTRGTNMTSRRLSAMDASFMSSVRTWRLRKLLPFR